MAAKPRVDLAGDPLPAGAVARLGTARLRHTGGIRAVAYSADGAWLASADTAGVIRVWDAREGRPVARLLGHSGEVTGLAFAPRGGVLASSGRDGTVCLWDVAAGKCRFAFRSHAGPVGAVAFAPDGRTIASGGEDGQLMLWPPDAGKPVRLLSAVSRIRTLAFSPDGKSIAAGVGPPGAADESALRVFDVAAGKETLEIREHQRSVGAVAWSPDGKQLASGCDFGTVIVRDIETGKARWSSEGTGNGVTALAFAAGGKRLLIGSAEAPARLVEAADGRRPAGLGGDGVAAAAVSPDGRTLAIAGDHAIHRFDAATGRPLAEPAGHAGAIHALAFSRDGKQVITGGADKTLRYWDADGRETRQVALGGPVTAAALSPDGGTLAVIAGRGLRLIAADRERHWVGLRAECLTFSPDGRRLAVGTDELLRLWDTASGAEIGEPRGKTEPIWSAAFCPDGRVVATGSAGGAVRLWDAAGKRDSIRIGSATAGAGAVAAFSPDGRVLAAGGNELRMWETASGRELVRRKADGVISDIAWSPDGRTLAIGLLDGTVELRNPFGGGPAVHLAGHDGCTTALAFRADGRMLASAGADGTALLWDFAALRPAAPAPRTEALRAADGLWAELGSEDPKVALAAVGELAAAGDAGTAVLNPRLRAVAAGDPAVVAKRIAELDDDKFAVRESAFAELGRLGVRAAPALRVAAAGQLSPEAASRIADLLRALEVTLVTDVETLRTVRAIAALERIGTPAARALLEALAGGVPDARETQDAKAALSRLAAR